MKNKKPKKQQKHTIYLAGPISGCNEKQIHAWRDKIKAHWLNEFNFLSPADNLIDKNNAESDSSYKIIKSDLKAIESADAILANMWKESIGTAAGIILARKKGKPIVIIDPNHIQNSALAFYSDGVYDDPTEAMEHLKIILNSQKKIISVKKQRGRPATPFNRGTLTNSIRKACQAAGRDDIIVPAQIVPMVLKKIIGDNTSITGIITTTMIKDTVWDVLVELESDPIRYNEFTGIRAAWAAYEQKYKKYTVKKIPEKPDERLLLSPVPFKIPIHTTKSHTTIWAEKVSKLEDIPKTARPLFKEISRVKGIDRIKLDIMSEGPKLEKCCAEIKADKNPNIILGKCYDKGEKGNIQEFKIIITDRQQTEPIRELLVKHLSSKNMLKLKNRDIIIEKSQ